VDQDPGDGQGVFLVWLAVTVFIAVEVAGAAFPSYAGGCGPQVLITETTYSRLA
jgi:hypothetical protein